MTHAVAVDWSAAPMSDAAKNTKTPALRVPVVVAPREVMEKWWSLPWSEVEAAGFRGEDGLAPLLIMLIDYTSGHAYPREGLKSDGSLVGKTLLLRQGW